MTCNVVTLTLDKVFLNIVFLSIIVQIIVLISMLSCIHCRNGPDLKIEEISKPILCVLFSYI